MRLKEKVIEQIKDTVVYMCFGIAMVCFAMFAGVIVFKLWELLNTDILKFILLIVISIFVYFIGRVTFKKLFE